MFSACQVASPAPRQLTDQASLEAVDPIPSDEGAASKVLT